MLPAPKVVPVKSPEFYGVVSSRVAKVIAPDFDAKVMKLHIRNGQRVTKDELVAELDDASLKSKLLEAQGALRRAKGQAARASTAYANAKRRSSIERRLVNSGAAAPEAYKSVLTEASQFGADGAAAGGDVQSAAAQVAELQAMIKKAKVTAPIDGVVSVVKAKEGATALRSDFIARVFDPNQMVVRFAVPKKHLGLIKSALAIELVTTEGRRVPATVTLQHDTADSSIEYTIFEAAIDPNVRTGEIRVGDNGNVRIAGAAK